MAYYRKGAMGDAAGQLRPVSRASVAGEREKTQPATNRDANDIHPRKHDVLYSICRSWLTLCLYSNGLQVWEAAVA